MNNDLWGWSCADEANAIQTEFKGVVNFTALCDVQVRIPHPSQMSVFADECVDQILGRLDRGSRSQDSVCGGPLRDLQKDPRR